MRIEKIVMEGIASYRDRVEIDLQKEPFSSSSIFVISGPTGAGKSTILDAITLALYHRTPRLDGKGDRSPENIINLGRGEGRVEVEFAVGGERYRATYLMRRGRGKKASLVKLPEEKVLADKPRDVEKRIPEIIGMDFDSFRRAVVLPQGEFAAFLKADPDRKREILEATVGMDIYERLKDLYNERKRRLEEDLRACEATYEELKKRVGEESPEEVRRRLEALRIEVEKLEGRLQTSRKCLEEMKRVFHLTEELEVLGKKEEELKAKEGEIEALERKVQTIERSVRELGEPYGRLRALKEEREGGLKDVRELRAELKEKENALRRLLGEWERREEELKREGRDVEKALERVRWLSGLLKHLERYRTLKESHKKLKERALELEKALEGKKKDLEKRKEALWRMYRGHLSHLKSLEGRVEGILKRYESEKEALERARRESLAQEIRRGLREGDRCPVCGGEFRGMRAPVGASPGELTRMEEALERTHRELEEMKEDLRRAKNTLELFPEEYRTAGEGEGREARQEEVLDLIRGLEALRTSIAGAERELERTLKERAKVEEELQGQQRALQEGGAEDLESLLKEVEGLPGRYEKLERRREEIREELEGFKEKRRVMEEEIKSLRREVEAGERMVGKLQERLEALEKEFLKKLEGFGYSSEEEFREVLKEARELDKMRERIREYREMRRHLKNRREEIEGELGGKRVSREELERAEMRLKEEERSLKELRGQEGGLKERLHELKRKRRAVEEAEKRLGALKREIELFRRLGSVLERNRLRDHALEMVLTYLLTTANEYLEGLTERRYLFSAEEGRILSSLKIVDMWAGGEKRPVETLSGGEQFLASLSLALALSELSSTRGEVGSLFLDEGFGTLDSRSLEMVLDALERLRYEGRMIGVISHLDEVKRRIPVKVLVRKSSRGSSIHIHPPSGKFGVGEGRMST